MCAKGLKQETETPMRPQVSAIKNEYYLGKKIKACGPGFWIEWFSSPSSHLLLPETGFGILGNCLLQPLLWMSPLPWEMRNQETHVHVEGHTAAGWGRGRGQREMYSGLKRALNSSSLSTQTTWFPRWATLSKDGHMSAVGILALASWLMLSDH